MIPLRSLTVTGDLVESKSCSDPFITVEPVADQQYHIVNRLESSSSKNPNINSKMTQGISIILIGVAGTLYNDYTVKPLMNLGLTKHS